MSHFFPIFLTQTHSQNYFFIYSSIYPFQQTKSIVHTLEGHSHNICAVLFHPKLPLIASASEDGTVRLWSSTTYRAESTLNYGMERAWALAATKESNMLACGFDEGCVVVELGSDDPVASMDNTGKVVWANNNDIQTANVRGLASGAAGEDDLPDGERLPIIPRDLGACELYPQMLKHNCNGRFVAVCGDGEFIIYTSQALRNKAFGQALDFVWSGTGTGDYAIRESISRVKIFQNFKEANVVKPATASAEGLFGGHLIGVKGGDESVLFYDWDTGVFVRKIDVNAKEVYWSDGGNLVCISTDEGAYVLSYNAQAAASAIAMGQVSDEDGIDGTFDLLYEINDTVSSGKWVGDCFIYMNNAGRLNYSVGGQIQTLVHLETAAGGTSKHSILGYLAKEDRVYVVDKSLNISSYRVLLSVLEYQTAVMRGDFDAANELLSAIPESEFTTVARFLESQGFKEEAMAVTTDPDHKFDLALELGHTEVAHSLMEETAEEDKETTDTMAKWKRLSDAALKDSNFELCEAASLASNDYAGLLLMYSAIGNYTGMASLAKSAEAGGKTNVAFTAYLLTGNVEACINILVSTSRFPEAAFFARTYLPSQVDDVVALWKADLAKVSESAAETLVSPSVDKTAFPDFDVALQIEQMFLDQRANVQDTGVPSTEYPTAKEELEMNLIELIKSRAPPPVAPAAVVEEPVPPPVAEEIPMEVEDTGEEEARALAEMQMREQAAAENARLQAEQEAAQMQAQAELARQQAEEEAAQMQAQAELARQQAEEEADRIQAQAEAAKLQAQAEAARMQAQAEESRLQAEMEAKLAEEQRLMAEMEAMAAPVEDAQEPGVVSQPAPPADSMDDFDDDW
jgi:coatomer subunit beta'